MAAYKPKKKKVATKLKGFDKGTTVSYTQQPAPNQMVPASPVYAPKPPAPPPPPGPQPLPFDSIYASEEANAHRQFDTTNAGLQYQWGRTKQEYGFDDASDPFSRARMLERNFQQSTRRRLNTSGNNLYSSSFTRGESEGRFGYERDVNTTRRAYDDEVQGLKQRYLQAQTDRDTAKTSAGAERIRRAQEDRQAAEDRAFDRAQAAPPAPAPAAGPGPVPRPTGPPQRQGGFDGGQEVSYLNRPAPNHMVQAPPPKKPKKVKPKKVKPKKKKKKK